MPIGPAYGNDLSGEYVFTGNVEFPNGTAAAPSIRGVNDLDTGWAWLGSDVLIASTGGTERVRLTAGGDVLVGSTAAVHNAKVGILGSMAVVVTDSASDSANKAGRIASGHYTNAEEPLGLVYGFVSSGSSIVNVGGGSSSLNAATQIKLFAAANNTTTTGTEMVRLTTGGLRLEAGVSAGAATTAILDCVSTTKGFLPPRMTTTQRDNISSPATGLVIYNTTTNVLNFYNGSAWGAV